MSPYFEWDPDKAVINRQKHGVSFETAIRVFADPSVLVERDRIVEGEERWQAIGLTDNSYLLVVAHTFREETEHGEIIEIIRIISGREANRRERKRYEEADGPLSG